MNITMNNGSFPVQAVSIPGGARPVRKTRDAVAGGMAFLEGELEKRDPKLYEPLTSTTWVRDIVADTGGGWVDYTTTYNVSYATTGSNGNGIISGQTNNIPVMQADVGRDVSKVFTWANILKVPYVDQQKLQGIGRSLDEILDKGIRINHDKTLDFNAYTGFGEYGSYGLVNHPSVSVALAPLGEESGKRKWREKTAVEILNDVNQIQNETWAASEYDLTGMANHFLIPPEDYAYLVKPLSLNGIDGCISIMEYLMKNNIGKNQGVDLFIAPCRQCCGAGEGGLDRMVAYANNRERVRYDITVPLERSLTQAVVTEMAYLTAYVTQFGEVKYIYLTHAKYYDGI